MRPLLFILAAVLAIALAISGVVSEPVRKAPLYLGMNYYPEPVKLGGSAYVLSEQSNETRPLSWQYGTGFNFTFNPRYAQDMDSLNISEYHIPAIVDFLKNDFGQEGINYSYYAPTLGDFASPDWSPTRDIHIYHVPAIVDFLENDWQPPQPEFNRYPGWVFQYLR